MKVEAYQCKHCKDVYLNEDEMKRCEEACSEKIAEYKEQREFKNKQEYLQNSVRLESENVEDICRRCIEVQNKFADQDGTPKLVDMVVDVKYHPNASNSHSSPISGVSNFYCKPELPAGYPALTGRVRFEYERHNTNGRNGRRAVGENILRFINKGSGGGDGYSLSYDVTLWLDDFPLIKRQVEDCLQEQKRLELLTGEIETSYRKQIESDSIIQALNENLETIQEKVYQLQKVRDEACRELRKEEKVYIDLYQNEYKGQCSKLEGNHFGIQVPYLSL